MAAAGKGRKCIYCSRAVGRVRKGEHIIPEAIGGALTIKSVCSQCNNDFSPLDRELSSRSPISIVASQQIDAHLWQAWDVDHSDSDLLLEAYPDWNHELLTLYPQTVFDRSRPHVRGDYDELRNFGPEDFSRVFVKAMLQAYRRYEAGEKRWLHFERVDGEQLVQRGYRLPARIFSRMTIWELATRLRNKKPAAFVLRYLNTVDRRLALNTLDTWPPRRRHRSVQLERAIGSPLPVIAYVYDAAKVLRAIAKLAVNLISYCCPNSKIDHEGLRQVINVIKGEAPVTPQHLNANGFIWASDIEPIKAEGQSHSFHIVHGDGQWHVYSSFFGGRIGTFVRFPGPNGEEWTYADIVAPLRSKDWQVRTGKVLRPLKSHIEWKDFSKMVPTIPMLHTETKLIIERIT